MNDLNSVLLEGDIDSIQWQGEANVLVTISTKRFDGGFRVRALANKATTSFYLKSAKVGNRIRLVGRLRYNSILLLHVEIEHAETYQLKRTEA